MRRLSLALMLMTIVSAAALQAAAAPNNPAGFQTLAIGDSAPDFKLPGVDDKEYNLKSFAQAKLLLVVFTCNHCPTAQAYESRIVQLDADYKDRGVALVAISPNDDQALRLDELGYTEVGDSLADMKYRAKNHQFRFPYLYDGETQRVSLAYGVVATPQVFLFDGQRKLRYVGRIDDSDVKTVTSHDLATRSMRCWPASRCRSRRRAPSAARPSGLPNVPKRRLRWRSGTRSRSNCRRSTKPA